MSETRHCLTCGDPFEVRYPRSDGKRYCSRSCAARDQWKGSGNPRFNDGMSAQSSGRRLKVLPDGRSMTYARWLMQEHLGRRLGPDEVVHHRNGNFTDDRIENLQVLTRAEHIEVHRHELREAANA